MLSDVKRSFAVADATDVFKTVSLALSHFQCGTDSASRALASYGSLVKPDFTLAYRGFLIPVSVDDTAGTLEARIRAYLTSRRR